jgi:hypothetical protein
LVHCEGNCRLVELSVDFADARPRRVSHFGVVEQVEFRDEVVECQFCGHVLNQRCKVVEFGLLRNVERRSNGRIATTLVGQVAVGECEGDDGFVGEGERGGSWSLIWVSFDVKTKVW